MAQVRRSVPTAFLPGWEWTAVVHLEDVEGIVEKLRESLTSGEPLQYEVRILRANGEYRWKEP